MFVTFVEEHNHNTVFIRIVAVATINFSLAGVWLLIEGGSYSRATAFIDFTLIPRSAVYRNNTTKDWFMTAAHYKEWI